jgi:hypothetical protein
MAKHGKNWDPGGHPGKLHDELGIPEGEKIPKERLHEATHSDDPEVRRDAIRAETMEHWHHGGRKPEDEKSKSFIDLQPIFGTAPKP